MLQLRQMKSVFEKKLTVARDKIARRLFLAGFNPSVC